MKYTQGKKLMDVHTCQAVCKVIAKNNAINHPTFHFFNGECSSKWPQFTMGPVRIRHSSHDFGWQSSHSVDLAGWQAKMASIEIWIPWRNAHKPHSSTSILIEGFLQVAVLIHRHVVHCSGKSRVYLTTGVDLFRREHGTYSLDVTNHINLIDRVTLWRVLSMAEKREHRMLAKLQEELIHTKYQQYREREREREREKGGRHRYFVFYIRQSTVHHEGQNKWWRLAPNLHQKCIMLKLLLSGMLRRNT